MPTECLPASSKRMPLHRKRRAAGDRSLASSSRPTTGRRVELLSKYRILNRRAFRNFFEKYAFAPQYRLLFHNIGESVLLASAMRVLVGDQYKFKTPSRGCHQVLPIHSKDKTVLISAIERLDDVCQDVSQSMFKIDFGHWRSGLMDASCLCG